jgi:hypothetical protein
LAIIHIILPHWPLRYHAIEADSLMLATWYSCQLIAAAYSHCTQPADELSWPDTATYFSWQLASWGQIGQSQRQLR